MRLGEEYISEAILDLLPDIRGKEICLFFLSKAELALCKLNTCSSIKLILSTSQSMRKRFSCRRSISSMMRLYSVGSTMFPTERAVTCQLLATADSMMAWRIANPGGTEGRELHHTRRKTCSESQTPCALKKTKTRILWLPAMVCNHLLSYRM